MNKKQIQKGNGLILFVLLIVFLPAAIVYYLTHSWGVYQDKNALYCGNHNSWYHDIHNTNIHCCSCKLENDEIQEQESNSNWK